MDLLGSIRISQRRHGLIVVVVGGPDVGNHHRFGVSTQRILQQPREFGVAVRDVIRFTVDERLDDITKRRQREVDLGALAKPCASSPGFLLPLAAGKVDE